MNSGEEFIVGANTRGGAEIMAEEVAAEIAANYYIEPDLHYTCELTEEEAEASGLDEY
jgi:hypothetical protein